MTWPKWVALGLITLNAFAVVGITPKGSVRVFALVYSAALATLVVIA